MWQKVNGKYHLLMHMDQDVADGCFRECACGRQVQVRRKNQDPYVHYGGKKCEICSGVWHINFTSVDDAKGSIRIQRNLKVLRRALELADRVTLTRALESRIRQLENEPGGKRTVRSAKAGV
jgi:hypothetical protein